LIYAICLLGAGLNHVLDIWQGGWLPYGGAPDAMNAYWTALAVFDPLAAALLLFRPRAGPDADCCDHRLGCYGELVRPIRFGLQRLVL
jgi:hypothetical protein